METAAFVLFGADFSIGEKSCHGQMPDVLYSLYLIFYHGAQGEKPGPAGKENKSIAALRIFFECR